MAESLLRTKLYAPPRRPNFVPRPALLDRLNPGLQLGHRLTLISAPAGFGKTTLASEWIQNFRTTTEDLLPDAAGRVANGHAEPVTQIGWLSLDENDNDLARFLAYFIAALNQANGQEPAVGEGILTLLQSPQPLPVATILTPLLNELAAVPGTILLFLDDYHLIEAQPVHDALAFFLDHGPPHLHLVIATRVDPPFPLSRLRARAALTEIRAADLRFTSGEAADFLNQVMGLGLSPADIAALETRTEGWITGLHLAALSLQGSKNPTEFIQSFTGSHRYVLDYLVEEVLAQQPRHIQNFLLQTAVLDRLTGFLCDALTNQNDGQAVLETLDRANLFLVPLDEERRWYRYHHLFVDLLRQRLAQSTPLATMGPGRDVHELHRRASAWYENNGLVIEAFHHAAAAGDVARAGRLIEGDGTPLHYRGVVTPVLHWLASLPAAALDARPSLWVTYAMTELTAGNMGAVEEKLQAAEAALAGAEPDDDTRDLLGRIASARANIAVGHRQLETIIAQSCRALTYLHPDNLTYRTAATWKLGVAYELQGDRAAAAQAFNEAISTSRASGNIYTHILATTGLGNIQLAENRLHRAARTYRQVLDLVGDLPIPVAVHVHLCLAQIYYEWNDLGAAGQHAEACRQEAQPYKEEYDIFVACQVFFARLQLAGGDADGAAAILAEAAQLAHRRSFVHQIPEVAAVQVVALLHQGNLAAAGELARQHNHPASQARVFLARQDPAAALKVLAPALLRVRETGRVDELLKLMLLQAMALDADQQREEALQTFNDALVLAEPGGLVRTFLDEGPPLAQLLQAAQAQGITAEYASRLLARFPAAPPAQPRPAAPHQPEALLVEPLSERELEVLQLIAGGLTNREIATRLYLSLNTIKVHTRNIYGKLDVHSRTQAVARARALGILPAL